MSPTKFILTACLPINVDRSRAPGVIRFTASGALHTAELETERRGEVAAGMLTAETHGLIDLRGVTDLPHLAEIHLEGGRTREHLWPLRRAYVVHPGAQYGVVRQIQAYAADVLEIKIFTDERAALAWLVGGPPFGIQ